MLLKYKKSIWDILFDIINYTIMILICIVMVYPFLFVLFYSLSTPSSITPGILLYPKGFTLHSYKMIVTNPDIMHSLYISVLRSTIGPATSLVVISMCAYVLSRDNFIAVRFFRKYIILPMFFSVGIIPVFLLIKTLQLDGTFFVYIIPGIFGVFPMVLVKAYIENMPPDLIEAAVIDGANDLRIYWQVVMPVCLPVLAVISLFSFIGHWNSYIDTQFYNYRNKDLWTLSYSLFVFLSKQTAATKQEAEWKALTNQSLISGKTLKMAMTIFTIIPIFLIYPFAQKYFATGIMVGAIKG